MMIIAAHFLVLFVICLVCGFIKFGEPPSMERIAPIVLFKIDNTYSMHIRNVGGFIFQTPFAVVFIGADGDTVTRLYGWANDGPID